MSHDAPESTGSGTTLLLFATRPGTGRQGFAVLWLGIHPQGHDNDGLLMFGRVWRCFACATR